MITYQPIDLDRDYSTLLGWWKDHGKLHVPRVILPRGWMAVASGVELAASFLYVVEGKLAMIIYTTTNPRCCWSRDMLEGVKGLYAHLESVATAEGCLAMLSMVAPNTGQERIMTKMGYGTSDDDVGHRIFAKPILRTEAPKPCLSH